MNKKANTAHAWYARNRPYNLRHPEGHHPILRHALELTGEVDRGNSCSRVDPQQFGPRRDSRSQASIHFRLSGAHQQLLYSKLEFSLGRSALSVHRHKAQAPGCDRLFNKVDPGGHGSRPSLRDFVVPVEIGGQIRLRKSVQLQSATGRKE